MKTIKKILNIAAVLFIFYLIIYAWVTAGFLVAMAGVLSFLFGFVVIQVTRSYWDASEEQYNRDQRRRRILPFRRDWNDPYS